MSVLLIYMRPLADIVIHLPASNRHCPPPRRYDAKYLLSNTGVVHVPGGRRITTRLNDA